MRILVAICAVLMWAAFAVPHASAQQEQPAEPDRSATGGATTLEDILARQRGEKVDNTHRSSNTGSGVAAGIEAQLGTLGGASRSDMYRQLRFGSADVSVSTGGDTAKTIIQDGGMWWLTYRAGPLTTYGGYLLGGMLVVLILFFLLRGRIRIDGEKTGRTITRFSGWERYGHWLFGGSFLILGLTGLISLYGRSLLIPVLGKDAYAEIAEISKWTHNNIAWAFMLGLVIIIVNWTLHNIPNRHDLKWLAVAGGLFSKGVHPPARKFNAGQKVIFWSCVVLGLSISISGLSLLFPFQMPMFAKTFAVLNDIGIPGWFGLPPLQDAMTPQEEMQYAQLWHVIVAFLFIAIILAHIYLGSVGMEGAFDAMGSGEVELQWAREHHGLWVEEVEAAQSKQATETAEGGSASPAE